MARRLRIVAATLGVVVAVALLPAVSGAVERTPSGAARRSDRPCTPHLERDPAASPPPTVSGPGGGSGDAIVVRVPAGRLYLGEDRISVPVTAGHAGDVDLPPILVADLRPDRPGWELTATVVGVTVNGRSVDARVAIRPGSPRQLAGAPADEAAIAHGPVVEAGTGGCVSLLRVARGRGWGSYDERARISISLPPGTTGDAVATLQLDVA